MVARKKRHVYREGDWVAVPMKDGTYAVGRIARTQKGGILLLYFFDRFFDGLPSSDELQGFAPEDAFLIIMAGALGILEGKWTVIPGHADFARSEWPIPQFRRVESITGRVYRVTYDESNLLTPVAEERCSAEEASGLPRDGLAGYGYVEDLLEKHRAQAMH